MTRQLNGLTHVEGQRFCEDPGLSFEDFEVGDIYEHLPGRTITETDNIWVTNLTMNTHSLHFDQHYAARSKFGQARVNSNLTISFLAARRGHSVVDAPRDRMN